MHESCDIKVVLNELKVLMRSFDLTDKCTCISLKCRPAVELCTASCVYGVFSAFSLCMIRYAVTQLICSLTC